MVERVLASGRSWPLFGRDSTRRIETAAQLGLPAHTLMQRAGLAVARLSRALAPHAGQVWIAAGPGNNGGDGLEASHLLKAAGVAVTVTLAGDPSALPPDARASWQRAVDAGVTILDHVPGEPLGPHDVAIDALLGIGANRLPGGLLAACIDRLNAVPCTVLSIDVPSGLDVDTGQPFGNGRGVTAGHTLSLLTLKPGLFTGHGRDHAGEVWFDALDTGSPAEAPQATLPAAPSRAARQHAQHKGSFGDVLVVGGGAGMSGACVLAARAAHAAGAGRVHVDVLDPSFHGGDLLRPELMFKAGAHHTHITHQATVVAGCGGGDAIAASLPLLLGRAPRLVLDADALNAISADAALQALLSARRGHERETVLTPHPLEAARLLGTDTAAVQADRLAAARDLSSRFASTVVLKGSGSVVASPSETPSINPTGNASLATAGTGDVLAGWIGGLWAAGETSAHAAAVRGTWQHGEAADRATVQTMRAADLVDALHALQQR